MTDLSFHGRCDSWADIRGAASQVGDNVVIRAGADRLVIEGTRLGQFRSDDFDW